MIGKRQIAAAVLASLGAGAALAGDGERKEIFYFEMPGDGLAMTHNGRHLLPTGPAGIGLLTEPGADKGLLLIAKLRNEQGEVVGTASEAEWFPNPENMSEPWHATWTIMIPGRGHVVGYELERVSPTAAQIFGKVAAGEEWSGEFYEQVAIGPLPSGDGLILGGSGEFTGATGMLSEWARLTRMTPDGVMHGRIELHVTWMPPSR
ncbi:MAG: hypothetical protein FJ191_10480 [Gammaproteobacteria bacterium]|nr:hypothetical protein [Gammaproteobacteria bacterium]